MLERKRRKYSSFSRLYKKIKYRTKILFFYKKVLTKEKKEYKIGTTKNEQDFVKHKFVRSDIK